MPSIPKPFNGEFNTLIKSVKHLLEVYTLHFQQVVKPTTIQVSLSLKIVSSCRLDAGFLVPCLIVTSNRRSVVKLSRHLSHFLC